MSPIELLWTAKQEKQKILLIRQGWSHWIQKVSGNRRTTKPLEYGNNNDTDSSYHMQVIIIMVVCYNLHWLHRIIRQECTWKFFALTTGSHILCCVTLISLISHILCCFVTLISTYFDHRRLPIQKISVQKKCPNKCPKIKCPKRSVTKFQKKCLEKVDKSV